MLLKNGYLIDPASNTDELMDIRVENGTIVELGKDLSAKDEEEILDLSGLTVAPGLIDTHIHFRDPVLLIRKTSIPVLSLQQREVLLLLSVWQIPSLPLTP